MTFASTEARSSLKITTTDDKAIEKGTTHVIATLSFNANDAIHHGHALIACSFPSTPVAQLPTLSLTCTAGGYVETIPFTVATQSDNFMRGHCVLSQCSAYTEVKVNITAQAGAHFIAKANTAIHVSLEPNDAMLTESIMPVPPALPPAGPPAIAKGFTIPATYTTYPELIGDYRYFPYSFDRHGLAVTHVQAGLYERSVDDGITVTVYVAAHWSHAGEPRFVMYKRQFTGGEYAAAQTLHLAGTGHVDYSSGYNFTINAAWSTSDPLAPSEPWLPLESYIYPVFSDGVGTIPEYARALHGHPAVTMVMIEN